jgi:hypothetical protein
MPINNKNEFSQISVKLPDLTLFQIKKKIYIIHLLVFKLRVQKFEYQILQNSLVHIL